MSDVNIPDEACAAFLRAEHSAMSRGTAYVEGLKAAAPLIVAEDYEQFATELRVALHEVWPEFTHGSLAWTVLNEIDNRVAELRGKKEGGS